ncbi:hypothetical protein BDF14DRAFT_1279980 [Spinellus fusiger]|nr:hypothetical protein BDF14DRAFT_1279980 [Spinellus fusiger]
MRKGQKSPLMLPKIQHHFSIVVLVSMLLCMDCRTVTVHEEKERRFPLKESLSTMPLFSKKMTPTDITANIDKATDPANTELDWSIVFVLCQSIQSTELGAKEARKLLQKKMLIKDTNTQVLALEVKRPFSFYCL